VYHPSWHGLHTNDPWSSAYEFLGHFSHDASPVLLLNVPGSHSVHDSVSLCPPLLTPYVPTGQSLHFVCSDWSFYVPLWHLIQLICPVLSCYVPSGQSTGSVKPLCPHLFPIGHGRQSFTLSDPVVGI